MRLAIIALGATAVALAPLMLTARTVRPPGIEVAQATDFSSAQKKTKDEYLKAAPTNPPAPSTTTTTTGTTTGTGTPTTPTGTK